MNLTYIGVERLFSDNIFLFGIFQKTNKQTKTIVRIMMSIACLLHRVAHAYHSALGHGTCTACAYLTACAARLLLVCYATNLFCDARVTCALLRHFHTLKFIVLFWFFFWGGWGEGRDRRNSLCSFVLCRSTNLPWTLRFCIGISN